MWVCFDRYVVSWTHNWSRWSEGGYGEKKIHFRVASCQKSHWIKRTIGICTYYRKFVKGLSQVTSDLTNLTKKYAFQWHEGAKKYFQRMKEAISNCHILAFPNFSKPFVLECDPSGEGIGAVLKQGKHPIYFESRNSYPHERI